MERVFGLEGGRVERGRVGGGWTVVLGVTRMGESSVQEDRVTVCIKEVELGLLEIVPIYVLSSAPFPQEI